MKHWGILYPLFFNVYMDNLSAQLNSQHIGCSTGDVNQGRVTHLLEQTFTSRLNKTLRPTLDMPLNIPLIIQAYMSGFIDLYILNHSLIYWIFVTTGYTKQGEEAETPSH